jgi:hypothetical protein
LVVCLGLPSLARADTGLPMIFVEWPAVVLALVPVILIEAAVYRKRLGITYSRAIYPAGICNLASTFIGYPLAWILRLLGQFALTLPLMLVFELVGEPSSTSMHPTLERLGVSILDSAWLPDDQTWMLPVASLVGLAPAFFVSVHSEAWALRRLMRGEDRATILALSYRANLASYTFLVVVDIAILVWLLLRS